MKEKIFTYATPKTFTVEVGHKVNNKEIAAGKVFIVEKLFTSKVKTDKVLASLKKEAAVKFKIAYPAHSELLEVYYKLVKRGLIKKNKAIENLLRIRKVRSLSGLVVISVLTKPYPCPGKCIFCPSQKDIPKSYLASEPIVMRAVANKFAPGLQIHSRLRALTAIGHPTDKIELRIVGGTWSFYSKNYQTWFITQCFKACNNQKSKIHPVKSRETGILLNSAEGNLTGLFNRVKNQISKPRLKIQNLKEVQTKNERSKHRIIGLSIETRPDFITKTEIKRLRKLGITRVELGVQSLYNDVLDLNQRGHNIEATIKATRLLKEAGFKICYQMMPNLVGSNLKKDKEMFTQLFCNSQFQPDLVKIYPCSLLTGTPLYQLWQKGEYRPYSETELTNLLVQIKKVIPYYCRTQRIIRDIPASDIVEGPTKVSNLGQIVTAEIERQGWQCKCIRCREIKEDYNPKEKLFLFRQDYLASEGKEIFLSFETKKQEKLYGLLRLRLPAFVLYNDKPIISVLENAAIIREIHTYGQLLSFQKQSLLISPQHKGLGKKLVEEAEKIVKQEFDLKKIAVISGVGVRPYWRRLGYRLKETYMIKYL